MAKLALLLIAAFILGGCSVRTFPETMKEPRDEPQGIVVVEAKF